MRWLRISAALVAHSALQAIKGNLTLGCQLATNLIDLHAAKLVQVITRNAEALRDDGDIAVVIAPRSETREQKNKPN